MAFRKPDRAGQLSARTRVHGESGTEEAGFDIDATSQVRRTEKQKQSDNWSTVERIMAQMRSFDDHDDGRGAGAGAGAGKVEEVRGGGHVDGYESGLVGMDERY